MLLRHFFCCWGGQPEPSSRARPDSIRTGGPNGGCGTHKAAENRQRHGEEVRSPPNQPLGGAGWAGRTAEPSGYGLQVRLAVSLPHPVAVTGIGDDLTAKSLFSRAEVPEAQVLGGKMMMMIMMIMEIMMMMMMMMSMRTHLSTPSACGRLWNYT